jgi:hypothetical protein
VNTIKKILVGALVGLFTISVFGAEVDKTRTGLFTRGGAWTATSKTIDLSVDGTAADGDIHNVIDVPAGVVVLGCRLEVTTAEAGSSATLSVGDGADVAGYVVATTITTTKDVKTGATEAFSTALLGGKLYTSADTIDVVFDAAAAASIVYRVTAFGYDTN